MHYAVEGTKIVRDLKTKKSFLNSIEKKPLTLPAELFETSKSVVLNHTTG